MKFISSTFIKFLFNKNADEDEIYFIDFVPRGRFELPSLAALTPLSR